MTSLLPNLDNHNFELILMLFWAIWAAINAMLWSNKCDPPNILVPRIITWWQSFLMVSTPHAAANTGRISSTMLWAKLRIGFLKLNVDGAWNANSLMGGAGAVIRDSDGNFVASLAMAFDHVSSPLFAEALAAREGLALVSSKA